MSYFRSSSFLENVVKGFLKIIGYCPDDNMRITVFI